MPFAKKSNPTGRSCEQKNDERDSFHTEVQQRLPLKQGQLKPPQLQGCRPLPLGRCLRQRRETKASLIQVNPKEMPL